MKSRYLILGVLAGLVGAVYFVTKPYSSNKLNKLETVSESRPSDLTSGLENIIKEIPIEPPTPIAPETKQIEKSNREAVHKVDTYRIEIDRIIGSFLTEHPDILGWLGFIGNLAGIAKIDPSSVKLDDKTGNIFGKLSLPGSNLNLNFVIDRAKDKKDYETYWVHADPNDRGSPLDERFQDYDFTFNFNMRNGEILNGHGITTFSPRNTSDISSPTINGYSFSVEEGHTIVVPLILYNGEQLSGIKMNEMALAHVPENDTVHITSKFPPFIIDYYDFNSYYLWCLLLQQAKNK